MEITNFYGVLLGLVCSLYMAIWLTRTIARRLPHASKGRIDLHVKKVKAALPKRRVIFFIIFGVINFLFVTLSPHLLAASNTANLTTASRLGRVALINLTLLYGSGRMNLFTDMCRIKYGQMQWVHKMMGVFVTLEVLLHGVLALVNTGEKEHAGPRFAAILAFGMFAMMLALSIPIIRRKMFEFYSISHAVLAVSSIIAILFHVTSFKIFQAPLFYGLFCLLTLVAVKLSKYLQIVYNSVGWSGFSKAKVEQLHGDLIEVRVQMKHTRSILPGSYIYLTLFGSLLEIGHILQSHPFQVAWYSQEDTSCSQRNGKKNGHDKNRGHCLSVILRPQAGFTENLRLRIQRQKDQKDIEHREEREDQEEQGQRKNNDHIDLRALIEGPYSSSKLAQRRRYDTVLLFASDIGIAGLLLYIKTLLESSHKTPKQKSIILFWTMEVPEAAYWAKKHVTELLKADQNQCLYIQMFFSLSGLDREPAFQLEQSFFGKPEVTGIQYGTSVDPVREIIKKLNQSGEKTFICVCAESTVVAGIEQGVKLARDRKDVDVTLEKVEFKPLRRHLTSQNKGHRWET